MSRSATCLPVILAFAVLLAACSGGQARDDAAVDPTRGVDPALLQPVDGPGVQLAAWRAASTSWDRANVTPFASDGHETAVNDLLLSPGAALHRQARTPFVEGDVLLLVSTDPSGSRAHWLMAKMAPGFHDDGGDWMYALVDPTGRVELSGPASDPRVADACGSCHRFGAAGTDFVFGPPAASLAAP